MPLEDEIADDLNGEQETLQGNVAPDGDAEGSEGPADDAARSPPIDEADLQDSPTETRDLADITDYQSRLLAVSKAVTERTAVEYQMYIFCVALYLNSFCALDKWRNSSSF